MMSDTIRWYDQNVFDVSRRYESVAAETVHGWLARWPYPPVGLPVPEEGLDCYPRHASQSRCRTLYKSAMDMEKYQREVDRNYHEFQRLLPTLLPNYRNKYALMKEGKILGYFTTARDAAEAAKIAISDGIFSIQEITDATGLLRFFRGKQSAAP